MYDLLRSNSALPKNFMYLEHIMANNGGDHEDILYKINNEELKYYNEDNIAIFANDKSDFITEKLL